MTAGIIFISLVAVGSVAFVVAPLLRKDAADAERLAAAASEEVEMASQHDMILASLKDLEEDRSTGKITDEDYQGLYAKLTGEAVEVMKRLDEFERDHKRAAERKTIRHPRSTTAGKSGK